MHDLTSLTHLIRRMQATKDRAAAEAVFAAAAGHLRLLAGKLMASEPATGSFGASDLVQEVYVQKAMRLGGMHLIANRQHFFSLMIRGMRQILIDRGRKRRAGKRCESNFGESVASTPDAELVMLRKLKTRLLELDPLGHRILTLRMDHGLTWEEIAAHVGLNVSRCRTEYSHSIHWLRKRIR
ncbi:MAG TPA: ECF-type sigma factor [Bryobacteraceae bacterium]|nr:ECF-type sigma factor [Bryobacteraceae bacterium]